MVKDLFKKIAVDWKLWLMLYGVKASNVLYRFYPIDAHTEKLMSYSIAIIQVVILSIIMRRWQLSFSWIILFAVTAFSLHYLLVTSVTNVGLLILLLWYYYKR